MRQFALFLAQQSHRLNVDAMLAGMTCRQLFEWADYYALTMGEPGKRTGGWATNPRAMEALMRMQDQGRKNG